MPLPADWAKNNWASGDTIGPLYSVLNDIGNSIRTWYGQVNANSQSLVAVNEITFIAGGGISQLDKLLTIGQFSTGGTGGLVVYRNSTTAGHKVVSFLHPNSGNGIEVEVLSAIACRINFEGDLHSTTFRTSNPGAGSKVIWADPADGYRLKFAN